MWKPIQGFPLYAISNDGRVRNVTTGHLLCSHKNGRGYHKVWLWRKGKASHCFLHRLIALHFVANPDQKPMVNHKDLDRANNKPSNLEWVTASENNLHSYAATGRRGANRKLNDEQVAAIRERLLSGEQGQSVALAFGVSEALISGIKNHKKRA